MANRVKEDEKNERIIRGLLKLAENRRCINCNSMGPQYVCTNFWTFVCTTCSGIHREFTHRVKSVSMAKFTSQEVSSLQGGGNARAKEIYFKEWDPQRHSVPDGSNVERLRDFIKHVYVDRRYTGERSFDKPPRVKMADKEDSYSYRSGSRSPPYEDKYGDYRRSPARFEVADDRHRDDRSGNRRSEDSRFSDGEHKLEGRSPNHQKELGSFSPPLVRPVRDILGENIPPLRVGGPPKTNGGRASDGSAHTQRTASSSSMGSIDGNSVELTRANPGSLIDFSADPEPPAAAAAPQTQQTSPSTGHSITQPTISSIDGGNWASFDFPTQEKVSQATSNANTLDSVISQLSVPAAAPVKDMPILPVSGGAIAAHVDNMPMLSAGGAPAAALASNMPILPPVGSAPAPGGATSMFPISGGGSFIKVNDVGQWPSMQHPQHSLFPTTDSRSTAQQITSSVGGTSNNNSWSSSLVSNAQGSLSTPTLQSSQPVSNPGHDFSSGVVSMPLPFDANSSGRKELPEGLFTATYPSVPVPVPGWQAVPPRGMGFGMQYPAAALQHMQTFPQSSKSANPFDLNNESTLVHLTFPSMASLQGALPNVSAPTGLLRTSSFGTPSAQWMPPQSSSYALVMPPQPPSYTLARPPSAYMGQQIPSNLTPLGHQGVGVFGSDGAVFGTNTNQQLGGRFSAPATPSSFSSVGGNPFG